MKPACNLRAVSHATKLAGAGATWDTDAKEQAPDPPRRRRTVTLVGVRDTGITTQRDVDVVRDARGNVQLTLRGTSDARSSTDRDTRVRIQMPASLAATLWRKLGDQLTSEDEGEPVAF